MTDVKSALRALKRPTLLVQAARRGIQYYRADRDLKSIFRNSVATGPLAERLLAEEDALETTRRTGNAAYSVTRHISVLTALMVETARAETPA